MARLNIDLGELPDEPGELYALAHIASIACGGHAGDVASMQRAVALAALHGAAVAAHPSYPDREHFGRRSLAIEPAALRASIADQCAALRAVYGSPLSLLKPHGALYHDVRRSPALLEALLLGAAEGLGVAHSALVVLGPAGLDVGPATLLREGFADRGYGPDGALLPRGAPGALLAPDEAAAQAERLLRPGSVDTICVHGDGAHALAVARAVRAAVDRVSRR